MFIKAGCFVYNATLLVFVALFYDLEVDFGFGCIKVGFCHGSGWRCMQECGGQVHGVVAGY